MLSTKESDSRHTELCSLRDTACVGVHVVCFVYYTQNRSAAAVMFFCPADHLLQDWQPRILLGMVEARSVNVKSTHTHTYRNQEKTNIGCSGWFVDSPGGGRGPSRERYKDSSGQSWSKRRGEGMGRGGWGGWGVEQRDPW